MQIKMAGLKARHLEISIEADYFPDLAGAEVLTPEKTECTPWVRTIMMVNVIDVTIKIMADQVVKRVSRLAAPRGPKAV
jgi:hypothetical protein